MRHGLVRFPPNRCIVESLQLMPPISGFNAKLATLDSATGRLPTDRPVVIVTASFEGQPADNAAEFVQWLEKLDGSQLPNLRYAVYGCGNREWIQTYQRIPKRVDSRLSELGGSQLLARGEGDASGSEFFESFDKWEADLFEVLSKEYGTAVSEDANIGLGIDVTVDAGTGRASVLRQADAALGTVVKNHLLTAPGAPAKRHIGQLKPYASEVRSNNISSVEIDLPEGMGYRAGDYLAMSVHSVALVCRRPHFDLRLVYQRILLAMCTDYSAASSCRRSNRYVRT